MFVRSVGRIWEPVPSSTAAVRGRPPAGLHGWLHGGQKQTPDGPGAGGLGLTCRGGFQDHHLSSPIMPASCTNAEHGHREIDRVHALSKTLSTDRATRDAEPAAHGLVGRRRGAGAAAGRTPASTACAATAPRVLAVAVAHPARGPWLRRVMLSLPIIATIASSERSCFPGGRAGSKP